MCEKNACCEKPEHLKKGPGDCSREQIKKCHGKLKKHPCITKKKDGKRIR